jgi:hypothetical protein
MTPTTPTGKRLLDAWRVNRGDSLPIYLAGLDDILAIEAEARAQERERLRDPALWTEAGLLDGYLNIRGVEDEAEALAMLTDRMTDLLADPEP